MSLSRRNCTSCSHSSWVTSWWQVSLICMENGRSHILSPQFSMLRRNCPALRLRLLGETNVSNHSQRDPAFLRLLPLCTTIKNRVGGIVRVALLAFCVVATFQQKGLQRHFPLVQVVIPCQKLSGTCPCSLVYVESEAIKTLQNCLLCALIWCKFIDLKWYDSLKGYINLSFIMTLHLFNVYTKSLMTV